KPVQPSRLDPAGDLFAWAMYQRFSAFGRRLPSSGRLRRPPAVHGSALAWRWQAMCSIVEEGTPLNPQPPALEAWVRDFVNSSPDPLVAYDGAGRTLWLNTAAEDLLGRARRDALGTEIAELSLELAGEKGEPLPVRVSLSCLRRAGPPLWLARLEDLRAELPFEDSLMALSHELRSPLQAILSWAQLLRSSPTIDAFTERGCFAIERNVRWQVEVIEDILEMSQLLSGEFSLERQPLPLSPFV